MIHARRIEHGHVEFDGLADPVRERRMIGKVVVGQRVHQRAQPRRLDRRNHRWNRCTQKMHLILRNRVRPRGAVGHIADE